MNEHFVDKLFFFYFIKCQLNIKIQFKKDNCSNI